MRTYKLLVTAAATILAVGIIGPGAGAKPANSGTWTFIDATPNPSNFGECMNETVPSSPADVNTFPIKVTKKSATLTTVSHNQGDWAAEVRDSRGNILATSDQPIGGSQGENFALTLRKGSYTVSYCNWSGEPTITVDWALK
ncbi:MAG TPA: hypothetical protein VIG64_06220 [Actinomycetota bacterium]|jgi:hypothetical protein